MSEVLIRYATAEDLDVLARIETEAAALFPAGLLPSSARGTLPSEQLHAALEHSCLWVAELTAREVVGFIAASECERFLHIEEMDVAPTQMRMGIGTQLLKHLLRAASVRGHHQVTLTTFAHIPWNAPFYRKHGFAQPENVEQYPHLARVLHAEYGRGLRHRVAMVADVAKPAVCLSQQATQSL